MFLPVQPDDHVQVSLRGLLRLGFEGTPAGVTRICERFRTGHFHLSKPYWDERQLVVQVVNPTAGIFGGDVLESHYVAGTRSRACVLSPSSTQVYTMPENGSAVIRQYIEVREQGALAILPRWLVLHKGARLDQSTYIEIGGSGKLFLLEALSCGRISHGEFLEFEQFSSSVEIRHCGKLILKERIHTGGNLNRWVLECRNQRFPYLANAYIVFPGAADYLEKAIAGIPLRRTGSMTAGLTSLTDDLVVLRMLGTSCIEIQKTLMLVYDLLKEAVPISFINRRIQ